MKSSQSFYLVCKVHVHNVDLPQLKKIGIEVTKEDQSPFRDLQSIIVDSIIVNSCEGRY